MMDNEPNNNDSSETTLTTDSGSDDLNTFEDQFFERTKAPVKEESAQEKDNDAPALETQETPDNDDDSDEGKPDGAEGAEDELDEDGKPVEEKPAKKVSKYQERINQLTAQAREAERALQALRAETEQAKQAETTAKPTPVVAEAKGPTPDDQNEDGSDKYPLGEFDPNYIRDLTRHTIQTEQAQLREKEAQERQQSDIEAARAQLQEQWTEKLATVTEQHEDFLDKTMQLESAFDGLDPQFSDYLVQTIKSLDHGPEVLYYFANHLDEAKEFVSKGPLEATLALGKYNAMFSGQSRKEANKVSNAPPPPQVNKGSNTRLTVAPDTDDLDAFSGVFFKKK